MKVLVTGAAGQLGHDLVETCRTVGDEVVAADRSSLDVTDRHAVVARVRSIRPDAVFNAAAYTAVDAAEADPYTAFAVNADAVAHLAAACDDVGARLVHVSTDYVFDGRLRGRGYREDDLTGPRSVYGRSKLAGEAAAGPGAVIARTSWVCGEHGHNMVRLVLRLSAEGRPLAFVDDQRGCPTFTSDLAPALRSLAAEERTGVYHLTNGGPVSWFEFVREILAASGGDPSIVTAISTADLDPPRPAPRPANSVLDNTRWRAEGHQPLRHHREPLAELVTRLRDRPDAG